MGNNEKYSPLKRKCRFAPYHDNVAKRRIFDVSVADIPNTGGHLEVLNSFLLKLSHMGAPTNYIVTLNSS